MKYKYRVASPMLPPGERTSPIMSNGDMEQWLNHMDNLGWEFVSHAETRWRDTGEIQSWWIFRTPRSTK